MWTHLVNKNSCSWRVVRCGKIHPGSTWGVECVGCPASGETWDWLAVCVFLSSVCLITAVVLSNPSLLRPIKSPSSPHLPRCPMQNRFLHLTLNQSPFSKPSRRLNSYWICSAYQSLMRSNPSTNINLFSLQDFCHIFLVNLSIKGTNLQTRLCKEYRLSPVSVAVELEQLEVKR